MGSDVLYAPDGRIVCAKHFAEIDPNMGVSRAAWRMSAIAGGVAGAIPFAVHMSTSSSSTFNGQVTSFVYRDWIAVICGVIAATLGVLTVLAARKEQLQRALAFAAGVGVLALGGLQIARGFGVFESPSGQGDTNMSVSIDHAETPLEAKPAPKAVDCADAHACMQLAQARREAKDGEGALAAFEKACNKGSSEGCYTAGDWSATRSEWNKAIPLYQHGCDLGNLDACSELGYASTEGHGVDKDLAKAKEIFEKACESGHMFSCVRLGLLYYDAEGVGKDHKKAFELFVKACDVGKDQSSATGCDRAGEQLLAGDGVKADKKRSTAYFAKGCERDASYCYDLGVATEQGTGVKKDRAKARELYQKACEAHVDAACTKAAALK